MSIQYIFSVTGRRALITGAASGIGFAVAEALAENGAHVALIDRDGAALQAATEALAGRGYAAHAEIADVTDAAAFSAAFDRAVAALGGLDIIVANAGITGGYGPTAAHTDAGHFENVPDDVWSRTLDVNLHGVINSLRPAVPLLRKQGHGKIIVTASIAGLRANTSIGYPYTASKFAVASLIKVLALELAPAGVQVNGFAPGPFLTNINDGRFHDPDNAAREAASVPLGRLAEPAEIKGLALLLSSSASSYITGAVIPIDGGKTAGA